MKNITSTDIKSLRKKLRLNTSDFGKLTGVSGRTVEGWEQGKRKPSKSAQIILQMLIKPS